MVDQINHFEYNAFDSNIISDGLMRRLIKNENYSENDYLIGSG